MAGNEHADKYTKPELREAIKEELQVSDKGGKPGEWSARKSQLLVQEYERRGGGYTSDKKDEAARSLAEWTAQDWQTSQGDAGARANGATKRYLPRQVWDKLSDAEKREAERTKRRGSRKGEQYVEWPDAVKRAMQEIGGEPTKRELYERARQLDIAGRSTMNKQELQRAIEQAEA